MELRCGSSTASAILDLGGAEPALPLQRHPGNVLPRKWCQLAGLAEEDPARGISAQLCSKCLLLPVKLEQENAVQEGELILAEPHIYISLKWL